MVALRGLPLFLLLLLLAGVAQAADPAAGGSGFDYVQQANTFTDQVRLPPGWGPFFLVFFKVLGVAIVLKGVAMQYDLGNQGQYGGQPGAGRAVLLTYLIGILTYHVQYTLAVISNTFPFLPDLSQVFVSP